MPPFSCAFNLVWVGFSAQRSIFAHAFALSSTETTGSLRLCSVPPPYGTTGSDVPLIITTDTGRVGKQTIVFGMAAPTGAIAAIRSAIAHPTFIAMNPPHDSPVT